MSVDPAFSFSRLDAASEDIRTHGPGPQGELPFTDSFLRHRPSGDAFGLTQNVGMGWNPDALTGPQVLLISTLGGLRGSSGDPIALGYHTGHFELDEAIRHAAEALRTHGAVPFAAHCSDPCDGRTQGTTGMFDSLAYRNDAATVLCRLVRSLPTCEALIGVATCDKGLPAVMMALAANRHLPGALIPGGVTLPTSNGEDTGKTQSIAARYARGEVTLEYARRSACAVCASSGGGCHFLGTAASSQVAAEALGMTLPHAALAPSGQPIWHSIAAQTAEAVLAMALRRETLADVLSEDALHNAMVVHAAFGGSTNMILHLPAVAFSAGLPRPTIDDWIRINRSVPRLVDALPNGPQNFPTLFVFLAGGVPEVMLHLRDAGLLRLEARTITGHHLEQVLEWWEGSTRRKRLRDLLFEREAVDPDQVIFSPDRARSRGITPTTCFPRGNLAPEGSVVKSTAIDSRTLDDTGVYRHTGPARVFTTERAAIAAIKGTAAPSIRPGDVIVLMGRGPLGAGMEETYQLTAALRHLSWGHNVALLTDARFSGVSTGACIGWITPEALAGGPLGKLRDGDRIRIVIDGRNLDGRVDFLGPADTDLSLESATALLAERSPHPNLAPDPNLPAQTKIWAALQHLSGGPWAGAVYDPAAILSTIHPPQS
ncbi:xylonate dehydratase YagF [Thermostilla marina]